MIARKDSSGSVTVVELINDRYVVRKYKMHREDAVQQFKREIPSSQNNVVRYL